MNNLMTKSFLSYVELKKQALKDLEAGLPDAPEWRLSHGEEDNLSKFFEEVGLIESEMEGVSNLLVDLQHLNEEAKAAHSMKVLRSLRDRMDSGSVSILQRAKTIKSRLEGLEKSNTANRTIYKEGSPVDRTRSAVTSGLKHKLRETLNQFQSLREKIINEQREEFKRRYFNATGKEASEEVTEKMMTENGKVRELEKTGVMDTELREREEAVSQIRKSLMGLQQVMLDMAVLVEAQGDQINDIEKNVTCAADYITGGKNHLVAASELKKKARKWMCWVWVLSLILILLCLIPILINA